MQMIGQRLLLAASATALLFGLAGVAAARGTVLRVDGDKIYVDMGAKDGVRAGMELELHHAIMATHPVTKKKVRDTFYLGNLTVAKAGKTISVATAPADILPRVQAGDEIELAGRAEVVVDAWEERIRAKDAAANGGDAPSTADDPTRTAAERERARATAQAHVDHATRVREVWTRTLGKPIGERVALWTEYVNANPDSPYVGAVRSEIASLTAQERAEQLLVARDAADRADPTDSVAAAPYLFTDAVELADPLAWYPPTRVYEGSDFELSLLVLRPKAVRGAWIHYRRSGDTTYRSLEMSADGDGYLRARLAGRDVRPPELEYFVELLLVDEERPTAVIGAAATPSRVTVDASVAEPPKDTRHRSRVTLVFDFVDFSTGDDFDQYVQAEADFLYRFRSPVASMRLGFATMRGAGGPKDVIDAAATGANDCRDTAGVYRCRRVAFTYTYVELERKVSSLVSIMARLIYGNSYVNEDPDDAMGLREYSNNFGVTARVRIGNERETNLALAVGAVEGLGKLAEIAFTWDVIPRFPIVLSAQVTDQPVPEDIGLRLIVDVGYRGISWLYPSLRASYSARDIDHAGVGLGGAINFDW